MNIKAGDRLQVRIEKLVPRGLGLAFAEGATILVPIAAKGDLLDVRVDRVKGRVAFAEIESVIEPSYTRIDARCEYYGVCGGCDMQHMNYEAQLAAKAGFIRDCLERIGKIEHKGEIEIIPSPAEFGYRSRARWHVETARGSIGYLMRNTHEVVDVLDCPILAPEMGKAMAQLRSRIDEQTLSHERYEIEAASDGENVSVYSSAMGKKPETLSVEVAGEHYDLAANSFFQGNLSMVATLVEAAIGGLEGTTALDLYCGVGLFTLPLARRFEHVIGVESDRDAVRSARYNVERAGLDNARVELSGVRDFMASTDLSGTDLVVLDPPRSGPEKETIRRIAEIGPKRIVYVSCEPSILARDLSQLIGVGYSIESIMALDLFPQTHHIETVVRLTLAT